MNPHLTNTQTPGSLEEIESLRGMTPQELKLAVRQRIGQTPMATITLKINGLPRRVSLKMESYNMTGSIKARTAKFLVEELKATGRLQANSELIDSTSGNYGAALALIARAENIRFTAVIDPRCTPENVAKLEGLGANVIRVEAADVNLRIGKVHELCGANPLCVWPNQYASQANPRAHYHGTAPEIHHQMNGRVEAVFAGVSTGGTLKGLSLYFRCVSPDTAIVAVDMVGSIVLGGPSASRLLTGIGSSRTSAFLFSSDYDEAIYVKDKEAIAFCYAVEKATGISLGGSSGAVLAACARHLAQHPELENVCCVCPDGGVNYRSTIYNSSYLCDHQIRLCRDDLGPVEGIALAL